MRILFVSDTHLGFDAVRRARIRRRRRSDDFLACYHEALAPALCGEVDVVVHGGDVFDHPRVTAGIVEDAFAPLRRIADTGCPVFVVAGNHERSAMPYPLLTMHPGIVVFTAPRTEHVEVAGMRLAVGGFAHVAKVRNRFPALLAQMRLAEHAADVRLLCFHHCVEGAVVSNPGGDFVFDGAPDVIRRRDLPANVAAVLSGHIHRHQILQRGAAPPVCYPGSVERTSLVERHETKGYLILDVEPGPRGGRLAKWEFRPLPARPMELHHISSDTPLAHVHAIIERAPPDAVMHFRMASPPIEALSAPALRRIAPSTMNVTVSCERAGAPAPTRGDLRRAALASRPR